MSKPGRAPHTAERENQAKDNKLRIDLDYRAPADPKNPSNSETTINYIEYAVTNSHQNGLEGQLRRTFARLQRKLDEALEKGYPSIELSEDERDLLRATFRDYKCPPASAKYFMVLEDEINRVT